MEYVFDSGRRDYRQDEAIVEDEDFKEGEDVPMKDYSYHDTSDMELEEAPITDVL